MPSRTWLARVGSRTRHQAHERRKNRRQPASCPMGILSVSNREGKLSGLQRGNVQPILRRLDEESRMNTGLLIYTINTKTRLSPSYKKKRHTMPANGPSVSNSRSPAAK